jgi:hypothetical protein
LYGIVFPHTDSAYAVVSIASKCCKATNWAYFCSITLHSFSFVSSSIGMSYLA